MRHLVSLKEQSPDDLRHILDLASKIKTFHRRNSFLSQRTLIMLFQKNSTRTRLSFEAAMTELGGHAIFLDARTTQLGLADFQDEIRAIMRMGDILMLRALHASDVEVASSMNVVPVIDACSEKYHPCQALGDIFTMAEKAGSLDKIGKVVWLGIENNVSNTLMLACAKLGIEFWVVAPERDPASLDEELIKQTEATGYVHRTLDLKQALDNAGFIHTDTWMNMEFFENGKVKSNYEDEYRRRLNVFNPYQINIELLTRYSPNAKIMHCMPCHVGYEITRETINHPNSIIFDQAENRKHIQKAILSWLLTI